MEKMSGKTSIVDVRTPSEFMSGHVEGSINIPLQELPGRVDEIRKLGKVILCCASGIRSMQAASILESQGIDCSNGGSWLDVNSAYKPEGNN